MAGPDPSGAAAGGRGRDDPAAAGHFTTMQVRDGAVQGLDLHLARLREADRRLFGTGLDEDALRARIRALLDDAGGGHACTIRIVARRDGVDIEREPPRVAAAAPLRVASYRSLRDCPGLKHLALGLQLAARDAAQAAGFDDALLVAADGRVAEGSFWNLLLWDGATLVWPDAPMLDGVTQQLLRQALDEAGLPQRRAVVHLDGLWGMRAAFALNSRGVQDIGAVDGRALAGDPGMGGRLRGLLAACAWQRP